MKNKITSNIWILVIGIYLGFSTWNLGFSYSIYWANLHSHTSFSDGEGMPDEAYIYARDSANIDILALTDHTHYMNQAGYQYIRNIANQFTEAGHFIAIAGQEFGNLSAFGHFSIFEADSLCPVSVYNLEMTYKWINQKRAQSQFNHPRTGDFEYLAYNRLGDEYLSTIEVVNGSGNYTPYYEELFITALNEGWHVAPVANQDNHHRMWGNATTSLGQIPLTGIWADTLTKDKILEAISKKRLYACEIKPATDRILLRNFSIGNTVMGGIYYTTDRNVTINLNVEAENNFARIILYRNGIIMIDSVANTNCVNWALNDTITNGYYFIKGVQQDGDRFWTTPIWVNYRPGPTGIEAWPNPIRNRSKIVFPQPNLLPQTTLSEMFIYSMEGDLVYKEQKDLNTGEDYFWNGRNQSGKILDDGIYFIVIKVYAKNGGETFKGKVALLK